MSPQPENDIHTAPHLLLGSRMGTPTPAGFGNCFPRPAGFFVFRLPGRTYRVADLDALHVARRSCGAIRHRRRVQTANFFARSIIKYCRFSSFAAGTAVKPRRRAENRRRTESLWKRASAQTVILHKRFFDKFISSIKLADLTRLLLQPANKQGIISLSKV